MWHLQMHRRQIPGSDLRGLPHLPRSLSGAQVSPEDGAAQCSQRGLMFSLVRGFQSIPEPSSCVFFCRDCVLCRAFPSEKSCANCSYFDLVKVADRDKLPQPTDQSFPLTHCKVRDENDCWVYYTFAIKNQTKMVYVVEKPGMREAPSSRVRQPLVTNPPASLPSCLFQAALKGPTSSPSWQAWSLVSS